MLPVPILTTIAHLTDRLALSVLRDVLAAHLLVLALAVDASQTMN